MLVYRWLGIACAFISLDVMAQEQAFFAKPMHTEIHLSGNFGELRGTHFHAGVDIKTQQRIGLPIYAPADGYVSRVKVSTFGYGKALYIDHPNGQTTLYGHLDAYAGAIADAVSKRHYSDRKFEIEFFPRRGEIPVKKGQLIAYSGNTGGSGGPHLHYEVRDTKTQKIINPLGEGVDRMVVDTQAPTVNSIVVYPIGEDAVVNHSQVPIVLNFKMLDDGSIEVPKVKAKGRIGFGIDTHDTANYNHNKNGVYSLEAYANGARTFAYRFDTFSFAESGVVNALIDYERFKTTKKRVQKLFMQYPYNLSVLSLDKSKGILDMQLGYSYTYKIVLCDFHGNERVITIPVEYENQEVVNKRPAKQGKYDIVGNRQYIFEEGFATIEISPGTFYTDFNMNLATNGETLKLHEDKVALAKNVKVTFDVTNLTVGDEQRAFIGRVDSNGGVSYYNTTKKDGKYTIYTKTLGDFKIMTDTTPPVIFQPSFPEGKWLSEAKEISFKVKDDLAGIQSIEGSINGKWILLDYEYKTQTIVHKFEDGIVDSGRNEVEIKVTDRVGNVGTYKTHFFRK